MMVTTSIPSCLELHPPVHVDHRGSLVKVFDEEIARSLDTAPQWVEVFWSRSIRNVVRGMHFQSPPSAVDKLVFCSEGTVFDVIVDLRAGPAFGTTHWCTLASVAGNALFVPKGCAHGFAVTSAFATICYLQSGPHDSDADAGIYWRSVDAPWPIEESDAILSERDRTHARLNALTTPFSAPSDPPQ